MYMYIATSSFCVSWALMCRFCHAVIAASEAAQSLLAYPNYLQANSTVLRAVGYGVLILLCSEDGC